MSNKLEALVQTFVDDLQELMRAELSAEVSAAVQAALGGGKAVRGRKQTGAVGGARGSGGRRSPEDIVKQAEKVLAVIRDNPGSRAEQLAQATGLTTSELVAPLKSLLQKKEIKKAGVARGTNYTAKS